VLTKGFTINVCMNTDRDFFKRGKTMTDVVPPAPPPVEEEPDAGEFTGGLRLPFAKRPESKAEKEAREAKEAADAAEKASREAKEAAEKAAADEAKKQRDLAAESRARARATGDKTALIAEAAREGEESWVNLRDAIDTGKIHSSEVQEVLSEILRALAKGPEKMSQIKASETILAKFIRDGSGETTKIDVNFRGPFGETALMQAAVNGRIKHVEDLIKAKADVNAQNAGGETALMWAAAYDEVDVIKVLLKNKASPKLKDELGWTALMVAAWAGNSKAVEALKSSSDKSATNAEGLRAEQLAAVDVSPAKARGTQKDVRNALGIKKGGRNKTQRRKKTNSKKRGTR
jgi:hypothetical protein